MSWIVEICKKADKQIRDLPLEVRKILFLLIKELKVGGPIAGAAWKNYGKLKGMRGDYYHCHLKSGRPTYVCCWELKDNKLKIVEVYYVGTHENAPY